MACLPAPTHLILTGPVAHLVLTAVASSATRTLRRSLTCGHHSTKTDHSRLRHCDSWQIVACLSPRWTSEVQRLHTKCRPVAGLLPTMGAATGRSGSSIHRAERVVPVCCLPSRRIHSRSSVSLTARAVQSPAQVGGETVDVTEAGQRWVRGDQWREGWSTEEEQAIRSESQQATSTYSDYDENRGWPSAALIAGFFYCVYFFVVFGGVMLAVEATETSICTLKYHSHCRHTGHVPPRTPLWTAPQTSDQADETAVPDMRRPSYESNRPSPSRLSTPLPHSARSRVRPLYLPVSRSR